MKNELKIYNVKNQIDLLLMRHNIYDFNNN